MKITKTYSIEQTIFDAFDRLTNEKNINKSSFIEKSIKNFLKENGEDFIDYVDKVYSLRGDETHVVSVISQESNYYVLDNGCKIPKILFYQMYKELESVDPESFFNNTIEVYKNIVDSLNPNVNDPIDSTTKVYVIQEPDTNLSWKEGEKEYYTKAKEFAIEEIMKNNPQSCWKKFEHQDFNFDMIKNKYFDR